MISKMWLLTHFIDKAIMILDIDYVVMNKKF